MIRLLFLLFLSFACIRGWAQAPPPDASSASASSATYDFGFKMGTFLPYDIVGVRDLLPIWGIKFGHSFSKNIRFEYDADIANAKGVKYYNGYFSVRYNFSILDSLPLFFLLGLDAHLYKRKNTAVTNTEFPLRTVTGWHTGVGGETNIFSDVYFRVDMKLGFSPGRQMSLTGGLMIRF